MSDVRVMLAKRFHTMEPGFPTADAVAVRGDRILAVGSLDEVKASLGTSLTTSTTPSKTSWSCRG